MPPASHAPPGATLWLKSRAPFPKTHTRSMTTWDAAQWARAVGLTDWYIWAAKKRVQQACREMDIHKRELIDFEDHFTRQLALMQQHVREQSPGDEADLAAVRERIQTMLAISGMIVRARQALNSQTQLLAHIMTATEWPTQEYQDPDHN